MRALLATILLTFIISCNADVKYVEETTFHAETNLLTLPYYNPDTVYQDDQYFCIEVTDSKPYYNSTEFEQMAFWYSYQLYVPNFSLDSIKFIINMPNRPSGDFEYVIHSQFAIKMQKKINNTIFENFLDDLLIVNLSSLENYKKYTSLLSWINRFFSKQIDKHYLEEYPDNSTWDGYNSFNIFEKHFSGVYLGEYNSANSMIDSLFSSDGFIHPDDIIIVKELIRKYELEFLNYEN